MAKRKYSSKAKSKAKQAKAEGFSYCSQPVSIPRVFDESVNPHRASAIFNMDKKWVNGTKLRYFFFRNSGWRGTPSELEVVRNAFKKWKQVGIGLQFEEVDNVDDAEIRIGFLRGDGAWSYLGRDILNQAQSDRTMNFGWNIANDIDTAIHEIGHTLAMPHEHQNPNAGIVWDEEAVYAELAKPPNSWSRDKTFWNIIRKLPESDVEGSEWDKNSIMHYPFSAGMILNPEEFKNSPLVPSPGLSAMDKQWVKTAYPPLADNDHKTLKPFKSVSSNIKAGEQLNFFVEPDATREYEFSTFGESDTVMVLFEDVDGDLRFVEGDDDSGEDFNASFRVKLFSGRKYVLRVRLYWQNRTGDFAVMMW